MTQEDMQEIAEYAEMLGFIVIRNTERWKKESFTINVQTIKPYSFGMIIDNTFEYSHNEIIELMDVDRIKDLLNEEYHLPHRQCEISKIKKENMKDYLNAAMKEYKNIMADNKKKSIEKDFE